MTPEERLRAALLAWQRADVTYDDIQREGYTIHEAIQEKARREVEARRLTAAALVAPPPPMASEAGEVPARPWEVSGPHGKGETIGHPKRWRYVEHHFPDAPYEGELDDEYGIYPPLGESGPVALVAGRATAEFIVAAANAFDERARLRAGGATPASGASEGAVLEREIPIWLVWSLAKSGATVLSAVALTEPIARRYVEHLQHPLQGGKWVRTYVEPSRANHLYAGMIDEDAMNNAYRWTRRREGD